MPVGKMRVTSGDLARDAGSDVSGSRILFPWLADDHPSDPRRLPPSPSQLIFKRLSPTALLALRASGGIRGHPATYPLMLTAREKQTGAVCVDGCRLACAGAPVFRMSMPKPKTTTKDLARCLALDAWWLVAGGSCLLPRATLLRQRRTASVGRILA